MHGFVKVSFPVRAPVIFSLDYFL